MINMDDDRIKIAFIEEAKELLESLNEKLLALEHAPEDKDIINEIFRLTHSVKGESSLVGLSNISTLAHKMEDVFENVRQGLLIVDTDIINTLFTAYDKIIELMAKVQNNEDESGVDISDITSKLQLILKEDSSPEKKEEPVKAVETKSADAEKEPVLQSLIVRKIIVSKVEVEFNEFERGQIEEAISRGEILYKIIYTLTDDCAMCYPRAYLVYNNFISLGAVLKTVPDLLGKGEDHQFRQIEMYFLSDAKVKDIIRCADVDQVHKLLIGIVGLDLLKNKGIDIKESPVDYQNILSEDEIEEGEAIEREWQLQHEKDLEKSKSSGELTLEEVKKEDSKRATIKDEIDKIKSANKERAIASQTIRVETDRLDTMMNLVGELIINHSKFSQIMDSITEHTSILEVKSKIEDATNELERISDQMQLGMMQVRMVPIRTVFSKFPRMVRDIANSLQKNVALYIVGESTEIDRGIVELITEPLTHLIRNSIDHGIESPELRERKGKAREGVIILKAYQKGSSIYIEVKDDGAGISLNSVKEKAMEKELVTAAQLSSMKRGEILNLIFEPGFSTKEEITGISGRGVGMDVVLNQINKLRGSVEIDTNFGQGTSITIVLPLTLTIVEALLVNVGKSIFAIPVDVVEETLIINIDEVKNFDDYKIYDLRDETLAVLSLSELIGLESENRRKEVFIVVVSYEKRKIGIIVDELIGNQDIVIKALDESLKTLDGIVGTTVLGDGKIALILHIDTLVKARKKEINKLAEAADIFDNKSANLNQIFDKLNPSPVK